MHSEFSIVHQVQFSETDMAGIAHFSNYFRWMEEVEHAFLRSRGLRVMMEHAIGELSFPRVAVSCEYKEPVTFDDQVELRFRITRLGGKSLSYEVTFHKGEKKVATAAATIVCCAVTAEGFKAIAIPPDVRAKLQG